MQNDLPSLFACFLILAISVTGIQILRRKRFTRLKPLLHSVVVIEALAIIAICMMYAAIQFEDNAVPTGIFPPAAMIIFFRLIIPYPIKLSIIAGFISATLAVITIFLARLSLGLAMPPELIFVPLIGETYMMAIIGVIIAKILR